MDKARWLELIHKIPVEYHELLLVGLANGMEITFQSVLRIEESYLMVRGRISGTTETGRVFFLPYDQLTYVHFTRYVPEDLLTEIFGELLVKEKKPPTMEGDEDVEGAEQAADGAAPAAEPLVESTPSSINVRERLRARLASKPQPPKTTSR